MFPFRNPSPWFCDSIDGLFFLGSFFGTLLDGSKQLEQLGKRELRVLALVPAILLTSLQTSSGT